LFGAAVIAFLAWFAAPLLDLFIADLGGAVRDAGIGYLRVAAWAHPLAAFCIAATGAINGAGRTLPPMLLDLAGFFLLFVPAGFAVVAFWPGVGLTGLWTLVVATQIALVVAYALYVERGRWTRRLRVGTEAAKLTG
jgi:Na+-driven multidrug efflux pump